MDLFGDTAGPHIAHFHVRHHDGRIELEWEVPQRALHPLARAAF